MKKNNLLKFSAIVLIVVMLFSATVLTASAAYCTGKYRVNTSAGLNVRSGAGSNYSKVGAASNGTTFKVSQIKGSWGYTSSINCTNGTRSGWICLDYCKRTSTTCYNEVFASVKGSGYQLPQALSSQSTSFKKGTYVYVWGYVHNSNNDLYETFGHGTIDLTLSVYRPNGTRKYNYTYKNSCCNWIGVSLDQAGTWTIQSKVSGSLNLTKSKTITVKDTQSIVYPSSISLNYNSITLDKGSSRQLSATVYPSNATNKTVSWSSSNSSVVSVSSGGYITGRGYGSATVTARTSNGKTSSCSVIVRGVEITCPSLIGGYTWAKVGDSYYLEAKGYPSVGSVKWTSSNTRVATISSAGKLTAKQEGQTTITVKCSDGRTNSVSISVSSKKLWVTGCFGPGYTTVYLNRGVQSGKIKLHTYDRSGKEHKADLHVTLRDLSGNWICEFDTQTGKNLNLGNNYSAYRVYIAFKDYGKGKNLIDGILRDSKNWINSAAPYWGIQCVSNTYV